MGNNLPLYTLSCEYARANGEIALWRESQKENIRCKEAIEASIRNSFDGMYLKADCANDVIYTFGLERVAYVLANTLRQLNYDGRFSRANKAWCDKIAVPPDERNHEFCISSHPAVLDGFVDEVRAIYEAQKQNFNLEM